MRFNILSLGLVATVFMSASVRAIPVGDDLGGATGGLTKEAFSELFKGGDVILNNGVSGAESLVNKGIPNNKRSLKLFRRRSFQRRATDATTNSNAAAAGEKDEEEEDEDELARRKANEDEDEEDEEESDENDKGKRSVTGEADEEEADEEEPKEKEVDENEIEANENDVEPDEEEADELGDAEPAGRR